ncbi:flavin reductase family protein [Martelella radicis]|uniref:Flavin reductase (DIM6/NTAB) family NADH-FMN oxidoreductase RutF n=1 Tax=Martelella radicis TaxID=1397476 RepID=A0A7W6PD54_9HYPH|nr:flavin reductase family protein [Martelella radicis]MBB4124419.1 flavin reductase (DIM6/NTAB) family NADH-FMN oxidoreductase RutF [Martelella radicis]
MTVDAFAAHGARPMPLGKPARTPIEKQDFRDAMASLAATVCIVGAASEGERSGRTATAVFSLSGSPPSILVSIDASAHLAGLIAEKGAFSLAMLSATQWTVADAFAGRIAPAHRFKCGTWTAWTSGNPKLEGAMTALDCDVIGRIDTGTHVLFAGSIAEIAREEGASPLIWHGRGYRGLG